MRRLVDESAQSASGFTGVSVESPPLFLLLALKRKPRYPCKSRPSYHRTGAVVYLSTSFNIGDVRIDQSDELIGTVRIDQSG